MNGTLIEELLMLQNAAGETQLQFASLLLKAKHSLQESTTEQSE